MIDCDAIIIGGGFAGLGAALRLADAGLQVQVFEAQDRVGGRVWSEMADGVALEYGGQFFNPDMAELSGLIARFGLKTRQVRETTSYVRVVGGQRSTAATGFLGDMFRTAMLATPPDAFASLDNFVTSLNPSVEQRALIASGVEEYWCRPVADLSFRSLHPHVVQGQTHNEGMEQSLIQGLGHLADCMATGLGPAMHMATPVRAVDRVGDDIVVTTDERGMSCRDLIVAAPAVVLHRIDWRAPEDAWVASMPAQFGAGQMIKVVAFYERPFWIGTDFGGTGQMDDPCGVAVVDTSDPDDNLHSLTLFVGGSTAQDWAALPNAERRLRAMDAIAAMVGPGTLAPARLIEGIWVDHPWCGGGYNSWPRPWTDIDPLARLRRGGRNLHFAGAELATEFSGYVEGALLTARDAATRILAARGLSHD